MYAEVCVHVCRSILNYAGCTDIYAENPDLLRDSPDVGEPLSEHNEHLFGTTAEGRCGTVKGRVSGAKDDHSAPQLRECSLLARTHAYKKEYSV